jgi:hypothetical protein
VAARQDAPGDAGAELEEVVEVGHALAGVVVVGIDREGGIDAEVDLDGLGIGEDAAGRPALAEAEDGPAIDGVGQADGLDAVLVGGRVVGQVAAAADHADLPQGDEVGLGLRGRLAQGGEGCRRRGEGEEAAGEAQPAILAWRP